MLWLGYASFLLFMHHNGMSSTEKLPVLHTTRMLNMFITACQWSLPWVRWTQSTLTHTTPKDEPYLKLPQNSSAQIFQKSKNHTKITGARRVTQSKFHTEDP
jgi:hypothetical protein